MHKSKPQVTTYKFLFLVIVFILCVINNFPAAPDTICRMLGWWLRWEAKTDQVLVILPKKLVLAANS